MLAAFQVITITIGGGHGEKTPPRQSSPYTHTLLYRSLSPVVYVLSLFS